MIDASIVLAPKQALSKEEKGVVGEGAMPVEWKPTKRRQKALDARWTKKHGKSYFGYKVSANADKRSHIEDVLDPANTNRNIQADRGYVDGEREARLSKQGLAHAYSAQGQQRQADLGGPGAPQQPHCENPSPR